MLFLVFFSLCSIYKCGVLGVSNDDDGLKLGTLGRGSKSPLRMVNGSGFRIALFADLHYGENAWTEWGPAQDVKSDRVMSAVLDSEKPDFVVYLGDLITANNIVIQNASLYWDKAISPTRKKGIPWASVFGNHDDASFVWPSEWFSAAGMPNVNCPPSSSSYSAAACSEPCVFKGTTRVELMNSEITNYNNNKLSYSINGPSELWPGVSNYVLHVLSSDGKTPVMFMYFFDSGGGSYPEVVSYAQIRWFAQQSDSLNPNAKIPEVIFWHIPSTAYSQVAPKPKSDIKRPCIGSINKESVASQEADWNITDVLTARNSVKAVFVGHNHGLDWCCPYKTLWLCFARHTGYGGYGSWPRGARIVEVTENPFTLKSWIRMEDGSTHSDVVLSS